MPQNHLHRPDVAGRSEHLCRRGSSVVPAGYAGAFGLQDLAAETLVVYCIYLQ